MSGKSCPKCVPGQTNMPKSTKEVSPPVTFILLNQIVQTMSSILSPNGAQVLTVFIQQFSLLLGYLLYVLSRSVMATFQRKPLCMIFNFKMHKQIFLDTYLIPCIFTIIAFVIVSSKAELISGFHCILFTIALTYEKKTQTAIITVKHMVYLKIFICCSAQICASFFNIYANFTP